MAKIITGAEPMMPTANRKVITKRTPDFYLFRLLRKVEALKDGQLFYGGDFSIPAESTILWAYKDATYKPNGEIDQPEVPYSLVEDAPEGHTNFQVRRTRFIPNIQSIFIDEQKGIPERVDGGSNQILDNPLIREKLKFSKGEIRVTPAEKNLYYFLRVNGQISNLHPNCRIFKAMDAVYEMVDFGYQDQLKIEQGARKERAFELAISAKHENLIPHAKFLGIPLKDNSGLDRDLAAIKADYKDYALTNSELFISSFSDPKTKAMFILSILFEGNNISINNGSATWTKTGSFIVQIPIDKAPIQFLAEYSLTEEGQEFSNNMKSIYTDLKNRNAGSVQYI